MSIDALFLALRLREISASEKLVMITLANYADENMRCYPSQRRLADETNLTDRTIRAILVAMEERGLITRQERKRPDGSRSSDVITLLVLRERMENIAGGGGEAVSGGVGKPLPGGGETTSGLTTFDPVTEPSGSKEPLMSKLKAFSDWWTAYPVKVGKLEAEKAYYRARAKIKVPNPDAELMAGLLRAKDSRRWRDYPVPNPATWLNQGRWTDEEEALDGGNNDPGPKLGPAGPGGGASQRDESAGRMLRGAMAVLDRKRGG